MAGNRPLIEGVQVVTFIKMKPVFYIEYIRRKQTKKVCVFLLILVFLQYVHLFSFVICVT